MKNFKNTLFTVSAAMVAGLLAALLSGCDGSGTGGDTPGSDAGRGDGGLVQGDAGRSDVARVEAGVVGDVRATSCQVPEPKWSLGGLVTTTPRSGYVIVDVEDVPCSTGGARSPTNCLDPVDGFASGIDQLWCELVLGKRDGVYYLTSPYLSCSMTGTQLATLHQANFGEWAVCSPRGKFLGWKVGEY